jgi:hypothetical protein
MKYENPILITLNNTLHIKADNLEAVEVDSSCAFDLKIYVHKKYFRNLKKGEYAGVSNELEKGINISELSDRIEVRDVKINSKEPLGIGYRHFKIDVKRVFLLPVKENKCDGTCADNECICDDLQECLEIVDKKSYTIEEIEKAIDDLGFIYDNVKEAIINNIKK